MKKKKTPPISRDDLMEKARAAVALCNSRENANDEETKMAAFLSIFHPEMTDQRRHKLIRRR